MDTTRTVIYTLIFVVLATLAGGLIFIYAGAFNVSARAQDGPLLKWAVMTTRERSVYARKLAIKVPADLDDPAVVMEGFKHYREMCVECHRAPGLKGSEISKGLNPRPPNFGHLKEEDVDPAEFFWIVKNGIRMTAMPAWGVTHSDDKIWALVAFLRKLPDMTAEQYKAMDERAGPDTSHDEAAGGADEHDHGHDHGH